MPPSACARSAPTCSMPSTPQRSPRMLSLPMVDKVRIACYTSIEGNCPTSVSVADYSSCAEAVPDVTPYMKPSRWGDIATYFFFGLGGTIFGGELGFLVG